MFKHFKAFTMAEVLMVIAVIGVTAALALPNVTSDLDEKNVVSALRKIYPEIETSYTELVTQYGKPPEWTDVTSSSNASAMTTSFHNKLVEKLGISKDVSNSSFILKDGAQVTVSMNKMSDIISNLATSSSNNTCLGSMGTITVDVNGLKKGENTNGRDTFQFLVCYEQGIVPAENSTSGPLASSNGTNTAWVLKAGNRDYLKCASSLSWSTKRTCK